MLERFKPRPENQVRVPHQSLRDTSTAIFKKIGVAPDIAAESANTMVMSDLRGVESHGVSNMMRSYVQLFQDGGLNPNPRWKILRETPGTAAIDADGGLVTALGPTFMKIAIEKARKVGIGGVTITNAGHSGPLGHHALVAAKEDMIGMVFSAGGTATAPTFGAEGRLGTNPIAIAAPARHEAPFLFDVATTAVAGNKIRLAQRVGADLLPGWISDGDGNPIMEEAPIPDPAQMLFLPFGGTRENGSHKGYGFGLTAEIMATLLSGSPSAMVAGSGGGHFFAAYDVAAFTDVDQFKDNMDRTLRTLRTTRPAPGHSRVLYPGLSEHEEEQERRASGIPLHEEVVEWFDGITSELSLPRLERM